MSLDLPPEPDTETATDVAVWLTRRLLEGQLSEAEVDQATDWVHGLQARQAADDAMTQQVVVVHETVNKATYAFGPMGFAEALMEYEYWVAATKAVPWVEVYIASLREPEAPHG